MISRGRTWAVVLAGGSGSRLAELTTRNDGVVMPKQFCRFGSPVSLLERTVERTRTIVPALRIIPAVVDDHRPWWQAQLHAIPAQNILVQSRNRGTGAAVLHALAAILDQDIEATVLVLPSDHGVEDEDILRGTMSRLLEEARRSPDHVVLLGAEADSAETSYGWIVRGRDRFGRSAAVERFVEKPLAPLAETLLREGALWNTFVFAATARALAVLFAASQPEWVWRVLRSTPGTIDDRISTRRRYDALPSLDFSRHVLGGDPSRLRVLSLPACGWTDLGTPERMRAWMSRAERLPMLRASSAGSAVSAKELVHLG